MLWTVMRFAFFSSSLGRLTLLLLVLLVAVLLVAVLLVALLDVEDMEDSE